MSCSLESHRCCRVSEVRTAQGTDQLQLHLHMEELISKACIITHYSRHKTQIDYTYLIGNLLTQFLDGPVRPVCNQLQRITTCITKLTYASGHEKQHYTYNKVLVAITTVICDHGWLWAPNRAYSTG